ncbi:hypothetical protein [Mesorhizobium sp.]|uniref:hypothetical protein n=1 Tax=Mesorhizobium sp. TaxID=1871066 RepID=UPI000FEA88CF|nr:hypothetical protein [Mesorhizobium sp.]RWK60326.1 MAG: hypothetical protein EOR49_22075 [Mesorhizobium sp.]RWM48457.1 MAG: hypothetical protein EOR76_12235 [Mesorhizobium sp.]RWM54931.1 MAG: hypothetical protein EOR78_16940 [Mesorhizobium sp.]RWM57332.1 MAG: hypothetical protein EOR79_16775 [Mesorhizobium sp.]RWN01373.1 MAG: hypothetical protein EOR85_15295 [Mesorhizobium sp.]
MIELLTDQHETDRLFRQWVDSLVHGSAENPNGRVIDGTGIIFSNSRNGGLGPIRDQIMLGLASSLGTWVVKIVRPDVQQQDKGKLTVMGHDEKGRSLLLRQGWLKENPISREVREDFGELSGLEPVPLRVRGQLSSRQWYVVSDISSVGGIPTETAAFVNACSRARSKAGSGTSKFIESETYRFGLDEQGRTKKVTIPGGTKEVEDMQGHVWAELKRLVGNSLTKPTNYGYSVDAMIERAKALIEIKTGVSAHDIYEAVGQLALYPSLIRLPVDLKPVLLIPDRPLLRPQMATALEAQGIEVHFYSVGSVGKKPTVTFSPTFLRRCRKLTL